ncbi:MAG: glycerophosphodiester phosphodiesterase [Candidatus Hydrogenedentes bacterium]|nr:glycerophosphodiester phosphodiesterase [Candidatus Hydrogenedentota bacterium]
MFRNAPQIPTVLFIVLTICVTSFSMMAAQAEKVVIAHRGASGYLPEHTLAAYSMAHALGADYLEPDLAVSKDGVLICLHDLTLNATTNVKDIFPDRARKNDKWYAVDFTLAELKQLRVVERMSHRFPRETQLFQIPTLEEMILLTKGLNASTGRNAGIYPELKDPAFYKKAGFDPSKMLLDMLKKYEYIGPEANLYIQCFIPATLLRLRNEQQVTLPFIQLISDSIVHDGLVTDEGLDKIAAYAQGIGPDKKRIEDDPTLVERAHARGLLVHPYTFRKEQAPQKYESIEEELHTFLWDYNIDGGFTDQPDIMKHAIEALK